VNARSSLALGLAVAAFAGCQGDIEVPEQNAELRRGAELFNNRCSGCHTLEAANSYGSKAEGEIQPGERTNGPNLDIRKVSREDALFAIRNGGFSGAIMPANVVVGRDAELVADFLARYSGRKAGAETGSGAGAQEPGQQPE